MTQEKVIPKEKERQNNRLWWLLLLLLLMLLLAALCLQQGFVQDLPGVAGGGGEAAALEEQTVPLAEEPQAASLTTATQTITTTATVTTTLTATAMQEEGLACVGILGVSFLDGIGMRIQLDFPGIPPGEYDAAVNSNEVQCTTYEDYPERLFCDSPKPVEGSLASISVQDENGEAICMESFYVPLSPTATPKGARDDNQGDSLGGSGESCQEPGGGCNSGACQVWSQSSCSCVLDPSCVN